MILPDFKGFPRRGRILGVDWGARRIGVAVSSPDMEFVFVRDAIVVPRNGGDAVMAVARVAETENVAGIIVGLPIRNDGTESQTSQSVREFAGALAMQTDVPICFIEENLTSFSAQEEMGRVRVSDIKEKLDSQAARVILENAIAMIKRA